MIAVKCFHYLDEHVPTMFHDKRKKLNTQGSLSNYPAICPQKFSLGLAALEDIRVKSLKSLRELVGSRIRGADRAELGRVLEDLMTTCTGENSTYCETSLKVLSLTALL